MYQSFGGATGIRTPTGRSYNLMELEPQYQALRQMHGENMTLIREKLYEFFNGWFGGPQLFVERYGHPQLRACHMPFTVNVQVRSKRMACFAQVMSELGIDKTLAESVLIQVLAMADWCCDQNEDGIESPMPPMAVDPWVHASELQQILSSYDVNSFFKEFTNQGRLKLLR